MMTEQTYRSDLAIPPGEYLDEILEDMAITQTELAKKMGQPTQTIHAILQGKQAITPDTAQQLEDVVGVPAAFWNHLESEYRLIITQKKDDNAITPDYWSNQVHISEDYAARATTPKLQLSPFSIRLTPANNNNTLFKLKQSA